MREIIAMAVAAMTESTIIVSAAEPPKCPAGAPYCLAGHGDGILPYWGKESALIDARKYASDGFRIEVWTSFGKRVFPE